MVTVNELNKENLITLYDEANAACHYYANLWLEEGTHGEELELWDDRLDLLERLLATF